MSPAKKNTLCKAVLYVLGFAAGLVFFATKSQTALDFATNGSTGYGELYRMSKVRRFKPPQHLSFGAHANTDSLDYTNIAPQDASVIFFGDSFGFCDWGSGDFQTQLGAATDKKIYSVYNNHHPDLAARPPQFLQSIPVPTAKRIFVYERVERNLDGSLGSGFAHMMDTFHKAKTGRIKWLYNCWFENTEARHELLLKDNTFTFPLTEAWNSAAFEILHQPPTDTPWFSLDPPILFYKDEVNSFRAPHDDAYINMLADNLAQFDRNLRENFNCTLVFVPVPNKISVYSQLATTHPTYDNFLPRLCAAARERGVRTVDLLAPLQAQTNIIYWPTDTHWKNEAIQIAVQETMKVWPKQ